MVDDDSKTESLLPADTGLFELCQGEATTLTDLRVVTNGLTTNGRAEELKRTSTKESCLCLACNAAALFATGLIEPSPNPTLPILAEVIFVEDVIMCETLGCRLVLTTYKTWTWTRCRAKGSEEERFEYSCSNVSVEETLVTCIM